MEVRGIELVNYRNYKVQSLVTAPDINVFLGPNAQGKTNILEAVYYAALGRSHRTHVDSELIRWEEESARIRLDFVRLDVANTLEFRFHRGKKRQILYNSHPIATRELVGSFNVVLFSPEDLFLVKGAPQGRRRFLDMEISQADPKYFYDLAIYTRLITQRNTLLKRLRENPRERTTLESWDVQIAEYAARVVKKRLKAVEKFNRLAGEVQRRLSRESEELSVRYEIYGLSGETVTDELVSWYNQRLKETVELDIRRGATGVGPHRDDLALLVNGIDLRVYGSQGQQRTGALALKLAELSFLREETGEYPILLLDDVMSELDAGRREELLSFIRRQKIQTFITATEETYFPAVRFGSWFRVAAGQVTAG
ncbi:MAG: DNA replication/repair protein RecF [Schwartzia sp.]|nr:DNA replication/repair protein RecF [Schwartzia sp. (in: firmicutes)]